MATLNIAITMNLMDGLKDAEGNEIMPISGLLSSTFMFRNEWVLDFGLGIIYKEKLNEHGQDSEVLYVLKEEKVDTNIIINKKK